MIRYSATRSTQAKFNLKLHAILLHTSWMSENNLLAGAGAGASAGLSEDRNFEDRIMVSKD